MTDAGHDTVVHLDGVQKRYVTDGVPTRALRKIDLRVRAGEFLNVVGPSGAGKTTLLHLIAGLETPSAGQVHVAGQPLAGRSERELALLRRRHIGFVFQSASFVADMTVQENVALAALIAGETRSEALRRAHEMLDMLGLGAQAGQLPTVLSGEERQRLAVARALANRPTVLLADEPTGALDIDGAGEVLALFRHLHGQGQTIILATHDAGVARVSDRTVVLRAGLMGEGSA